MRKQKKIILLAVLFTAVAVFCEVSVAETVSFRNGVDGYTGNEDATLAKNHLEYNYGIGTTVTIQGEGPQCYKQILLKFDISSLPVDRTIESATLRVKLYTDIISGSTTRRGMMAYPMLVSVNYGLRDGPAHIGEVDMHQRAQAQTNWGLPNTQNQGPQPGDYDNTATPMIASYYLADIGTFIELDITDFLLDWYDGTLVNHGLVLFGDTDQTAGLFWSAEAGVIADRPELVINYNSGPVCGDLLYLHPIGDFNKDCYVNWKDLRIMAEAWLNCTDPNPPCNFSYDP